mgnify:CR=1 FL=1
MFPAFANLALLAGLAAIAAPIIIHLLLRRKSQRLRFSTIQFFIKQDEQLMRRRKLRNLLLLATRVLLFALLVLAFARPFLPNQLAAADGRNRRQLVLLLDASASMQAVGTEGTQWRRATDLARQELDKLGLDDRAALVICSGRTELISEFAPAQTVLRKLDALKPGFGISRLDDGLRQVQKVLATANPALPTELCIISDLQRSACDNLASAPLPNDLPVRFVDLRERLIPNAAVSGFQLETTPDSGPQAILTSFSDENVNAPFVLKIDQQELFQGTITLDAGAVTNLPLAIPALKPGWHSAEFSIQAKDGLGADNTAYATIYVPPPIHGLIVETRDVPQRFQEESFFVATALNPAADGEASPSRFSYEKIRLDDLPQKIIPRAGHPNVQFLVIPGLKSLPGSIAAALNSFVQGGGGLLLFLGEDASAIGYSALGELLPAQPGNDELPSDGSPGWRIGNYEKDHSIFSVFREPNSGDLFLPELTRRFAMTVLPGSDIIAAMEDGTPLIVTRTAGQGRVVLVNSSADTVWNDWPKHKTFLPWLHSTALYLSGRDQWHEREPLPVHASGTEMDFELAADTIANTNAISRLTFSFHRAGDEPLKVTSTEDGVLQSLPLTAPGIYSLKNSAGHEVARFAANLPSSESDLATLAPAQAEQQLVRGADSRNAVLAAGLFGDPTRGKELWRILLFAALAILLLEPFLANRMFA